LTQQTRQAVDHYIEAAGKKPGEFLFIGRSDHNRSMTTPAICSSRLDLVATTGLDRHFGTHSLRRAKATLIYRQNGNLRAAQLLLGHTKIENIVRYRGIDVDDAPSSLNRLTSELQGKAELALLLLQLRPRAKPEMGKSIVCSASGPQSNTIKNSVTTDY